MKTLTRLSFLLLVTLIFFSCKKSDPAPENNNTPGESYVKIKKNGTWVTYKGLGELGPDLGDASKTDLGITAQSDDLKDMFDISIQLDGTSFPTGTYHSDVYPLYYVVVNFTANPNPSVMKWYDIEDVDGRAPSKYSINITSITPTQIAGNFTGNYLYDNFSSDDADGGVVEITEGEFKVNRVR